MRFLLLIPPALLLASGCARKPQTVAQAASAPGAPASWSGSFQPQQQRTGAVGPTGSTRAFGSVKLLAVPGDPNRAQVQIQLTAPVRTGQTVAWGLFPGRCGSGSGMAMPVAPLSALPPIQIDREGSVQLNLEVGLTLPGSGVYHFNVFWDARANDLADVMACANLTQSGG